MAQAFTPDSDFAAQETPRVPNRLQSLTALARFEFEAGKSHEGTKILMVEWEDDDLTRSSTGSWHVSWDGKRTVLPADEQTSDHVRRCYFLLPPQAPVPPTINLTYEPAPTSASTAKRGVSIQINPLPAIFPPELGATARTAGKKGVLHTIWAKKRLQVLEKEITEESRCNAEGVALQMALQEKEWIEANFGVGGRQLAALQIPSIATLNAPPLSPTTPVSPTGGKRLSEKLKGLKLGTSEKDLSRRASANLHSELHPLSPDEPDVAISSFSSFHISNTPVSAQSQDSEPQSHPQPQSQSQPQRSWLPLQQPQSSFKFPVAHAPPDHIQQQQGYGITSMASRLTENINNVPTGNKNTTDAGDPDGLFAKALSPRSPDIPKSPFSFSSEETIPLTIKQLNA
ncbi:hypothetical protein FQN57_003016 [Myotisia sp. PD_48]|nr:hypothetical protein FQN57_003016 [Myotisia sp. PD_48]